LKLEHHKQQVVPFSTFLFRLFRYFLFAFALVLLSIGIGLIGYHALCELSWLDSLHQASLILTGMGPVVEMQTPGAKIFDSIYALYNGVAFLSITAMVFAPVIHRILHILHVDARE
jgi:hypothetical protein